MTTDFPFSILRPDSPTEPAFTISEVSHRAKMDQNESPLDVPDEVKEAILGTLSDMKWNRYPQPKKYTEVKEAFAPLTGQKPENVILTVGGDQMILLAYLAVGGGGRSARVFLPTYPIIPAFGRTTLTKVDEVILGPDFDIAARGLGDDVHLLILVSPNNPTGNGPDRNLIKDALKRNCLVFLDEAYADYAGESAVDLVHEHPNLLVSRSLSKSLLAGVRLGYGIGHASIINVLERLIFAPYHLNALQLACALHYDLIKPGLDDLVSGIRAERERVQTALGNLAIRYWPSRANFVLFEVENAASTYKKLLEHGIRIRDVSRMQGMREHLRVTIGTPEENDMFLDALKTSI